MGMQYLSQQELLFFNRSRQLKTIIEHRSRGFLAPALFNSKNLTGSALSESSCDVRAAASCNKTVILII